MRFEICNFLFEYYFGRVCSEKSEGLHFNEAFFNSLRVTETKMGILKCLSWFKMSTPPGGGAGDSTYERGGDARRKFWIEPLKETDLGVAQAFFDPLKRPW